MLRKLICLMATLAIIVSSSCVMAKKEPWEDEKYRTKQYSYLYSAHTIYFEDIENLMHISENLVGKYYTQMEWMALYNAQSLYLNILKLDESIASVKSNINSINNSMVLNEVKVKLGMATSLYNSNKDSLITLKNNLEDLEESRRTMVKNLNVLLGYEEKDQLTVCPITELTFDTSDILSLKASQRKAGNNSFIIGNSELSEEVILDKIDAKVETIHSALLDSINNYKDSVYAVNDGMDKRAVYNLQYELGMISKMNYESLIASLSTNLNKGNTKLVEVYQNYVDYTAAINGYIPNLVTTQMGQQ